MDAPSVLWRHLGEPGEWHTSVMSGGDAQSPRDTRKQTSLRASPQSELRACRVPDRHTAQFYAQTKHLAALFGILWMFLMFVAELIYCRVLHGRYRWADNGRSGKRQHSGN